MHPGIAPTARPQPPEFRLRKLTKVAYGMSVTTGGLGQVLFLGSVFGGFLWSYVAATGLAAFAEFVMAASGDASLEHRVHQRAWKSMLALALGVAGYAAANQIGHFWGQNKALAVTFAGASVAGFLLHILDGHIRAAAYLRELAAWSASGAVVSGEVPSPRAPLVPAADVPPDDVPDVVAPPVVAAPVVSAGGRRVAAVEERAAPAPAVSNVVPMPAASVKDRCRAWFMEQVFAHGRNPLDEDDIKAAEVDRAAGASVGYSKRHIKTWRAEAADRLAAADFEQGEQRVGGRS